MTVGRENFGGPGRIALLAKIAECGSISQAAKAIRMSYKAVWAAIDTMNSLAGEPLVERLSGGKGGGGTYLTRRGEQVVKNFRLIEREHRHFIEQLGKISARNQFLGKVTRVKPGAVNDEIELEMAGGQKIVAIITHESTNSLGLRLGTEAFALIKSSSIFIEWMSV